MCTHVCVHGACTCVYLVCVQVHVCVHEDYMCVHRCLRTCTVDTCGYMVHCVLCVHVRACVRVLGVGMCARARVCCVCTCAEVCPPFPWFPEYPCKSTPCGEAWTAVRLTPPQTPAPLPGRPRARLSHREPRPPCQGNTTNTFLTEFNNTVL